MLMPKIDKRTFDEISKHVSEHFGIHLTEGKLNLVENRLMKRVRDAKFLSFEAYSQFLFGPQGKEELNLLTDLLSTNKTYFYRESAHFDFLQKRINHAKPNQTYSIWSAACSAGDEVYTIASIFEEINKVKPLRYNIVGTDISSRMIAEAEKGIYPMDRLTYLPEHLLKSYFNKEKSSGVTDYYQVSPLLRQSVKFQKFNLIKDMTRMPEKFDYIFCRNVLIYFRDETKLQVVADLIKKLKPGGYLFLGLCEAMLCRNTQMIQIQPSVFQLPE